MSPSDRQLACDMATGVLFSLPGVAILYGFLFLDVRWMAGGLAGYVVGAAVVLAADWIDGRFRRGGSPR